MQCRSRTLRQQWSLITQHRESLFRSPTLDRLSYLFNYMGNKQELKPCPFCGEQPMVSEKTLSVYCKNALCPETIANESDNLVDAIEAWNTRPDHSEHNLEMIQGETLTTEINWEQRKWDMSSDFFNRASCELFMHFTTKPFSAVECDSAENRAKESIKLAEVFIKQFKQQSDE